MSKKIALVTGSSSGFGRLTAEALARAGHTVYASMRDVAGRNAGNGAQLVELSDKEGIDLRPIELDVQSEPSVRAAIDKIIAKSGQIDVVVHNAGHMMFGPAEAFTPEQFAQQYDVNVLGTQRVNRAVLPHMRARREGLLVWISSSSSAGGTPPYLSPYFAAKAAMDSLAVQYSRELARWGIETTIVVPGAFTKGTNHFAHSGSPADAARLAEYEADGPYAGPVPTLALKPSGNGPTRPLHEPPRHCSGSTASYLYGPATCSQAPPPPTPQHGTEKPV
jgi:NAD(P)-dependent dehydrogenase (short-subunit alcohol dehydrogenase family)